MQCDMLPFSENNLAKPCLNPSAFLSIKKAVILEIPDLILYSGLRSLEESGSQLLPSTITIPRRV